MKATGIVRRIDDLGRVVIPKEIRRTLRVREGEPVEIFTDREGQIILKKYYPIGEVLAQNTGLTVCICDKDLFIAASGNGRREILDKEISKELEHRIADRMTIVAAKDDRDFIQVTQDKTESVFLSEIITPIISEGDAIGAVLLLGPENKKLGETEKKLALTAAGFLGRQMED